MFIGCNYHTQSAALSFEKIFLLEIVKNICEVFLNLNFYKQRNKKTLSFQDFEATSQCSINYYMDPFECFMIFCGHYKLFQETFCLGFLLEKFLFDCVE